MLELQLRPEFRSKRLKGTAIDFNDCIEQDPEQFLDITYPTGDLIKLLRSIEIGQDRPVVLMGERGQGKSHLMVTLYHVFKNPDKSKLWIEGWKKKDKSLDNFDLNIKNNMMVIAESLQKQNYKFLWDILLDRHPKGEYIRGKWEGMGERKTDILSHDLIVEMLQLQPVVLILDEFQTWYEGLTNTKQYPWKNWAFNFIQILSEIAKERPDLLTLVVSVRNGSTEAYQQIHRVNPIVVDFKGENSKRDRKRLLIHRIFENRRHVYDEDILKLIKVHINEYIRLLNIPETEQEHLKQEFIDTWPFAPYLMNLLEDHVLVATDAQETRELIKILVNLYKAHKDTAVVITPAHFTINDKSSEIVDLLDILSNDENIKLKDKAVRNLEAIYEAIKMPEYTVPHAKEIISSLWVRSLSFDRFKGASSKTIHIDITQDKVIEDNKFDIELASIVDNSFNIHELGNKLVFKNEENPKSKLMSTAKNDKLFKHDEDIDELASQIKKVILDDVNLEEKYNLIVLKKNWRHRPWDEVQPNENPQNWDNRIPVILIPDTDEDINLLLGTWLKENVNIKRNTIRFLIADESIYFDRNLIVLARAVLKSKEWKTNEPQYSSIYKDIKKELRDELKSKFNRFAILENWSFNNPQDCRFHVEKHGVDSSKILLEIDEQINKNIFIPEDLEEVVDNFASKSKTIGELLNYLKEPRPNYEECIPWIGESSIKEFLIKYCSSGNIVLNLRGSEYLTKKKLETEDIAYNSIKSKVGDGRKLEEITLMTPENVPMSTSQVKFNNIPTKLNDTENKSDNIDRPIINTHENHINMQEQFEFTKPKELVDIEDSLLSQINLLGRLEQWNIQSNTKIKNISISIDELNGKDLINLIENLPDELKYNIKLTKEE